MSDTTIIEIYTDLDTAEVAQETYRETFSESLIIDGTDNVSVLFPGALLPKVSVSGQEKDYYVVIATKVEILP